MDKIDLLIPALVLIPKPPLKSYPVCTTLLKLLRSPLAHPSPPLIKGREQKPPLYKGGLGR